MSEQRVEEILQRPSAGSPITELGAAFLIVALLAHNNIGEKESPPAPTPSRPCVMKLTETTCPK